MNNIDFKSVVIENKELGKIIYDLIFKTEELETGAFLVKSYNPSNKVKKFELSEDEIIQEDLIN